jgi:uncharacterized protein YbjT (DUF2867 family)
MSDGSILLTGATGYVGGRLLPALEACGRPVRCLARRPEFLAARVAASTEIVAGDLLDPGSVRAALGGIETAYYMVHSMGSKADFQAQDRRAAEMFGQEAKRAGVRRIVYLGGLGSGSDLSPHLASRQEVGRILRTITPRWVRVEAQPISIEDAIAYPVAALEAEGIESSIVEIGGADRVSYQEIMLQYARQRGLRRFFLPVPVLTPALSSLWLGLVTPLYARVGRKLIDSIRNPTVIESDRHLELFPSIQPRGIGESIAHALQQEDARFLTRFSDSISSTGATDLWLEAGFGTRLIDSRQMKLSFSTERAFEPIRRIGGTAGWYYGDWLWQLRGIIDLLIGGVGLRRGRPRPEDLRPGDKVDFWRIEAIAPNRLLRLRAEMKLPGRAWLQFEVEPNGDGSTVRQTVIFDPCGLGGRLYWYALYPIHTLVLKGMLRGITSAAERS